MSQLGYIQKSYGKEIKIAAANTYGYNVTTDELGNVTGSHIALNGWGIISVLLIGAAALTIINDIIDAYSKEYSLTTQCLVGLKNRIIPIAIAIGVCVYLKGVLEQVIFCLTVIGISQIAAVPLNPLPKWKHDKKGEDDDYSDLLTGLAKLIKEHAKKKGDK